MNGMKWLIISILVVGTLVSTFLIYVHESVSYDDVFLYDLKQRCSFATKERMVAPSSYKILELSLTSKKNWSQDRIDNYFSRNRIYSSLKEKYNDPKNFYNTTALVKFSSKNRMGVDLIGYSSCEYYIDNTREPRVDEIGEIDIDGHNYKKDSLDYIYAELTLNKHGIKYSLIDKIKTLMNIEFEYKR